MTKNDMNLLKRKIEALLFVSTGSVPISDLAKFLEISTNELNKIVEEMNLDFIENRGIQIQKHKNRLRLTSSPDFSETIESYLELEITTSLSRAALEALSIIAYNQPVTRPQIDEIRGVNSDGVVRNLLSKGLIEELGRAEAPGRPILYGTTEDFLQYFGLKYLEDLPDIHIQKEKNGNGVLKQ